MNFREEGQRIIAERREASRDASIARREASRDTSIAATLADARRAMVCSTAAIFVTTVLVSAIAITILLHLSGWCRGLDNWQAQQQRAAGHQEQAEANAAAITANLKTLSADLLAKERAIDTAPLQAAIQNLRTATARAAAATGDAQAITGELREQMPLAEMAAALLWQHTDNAVAHVDTATLAEQGQQKAIAEFTEQNLTASKKAIGNFDQTITDMQLPLLASHLNGAAVGLQGVAEDAHVVSSYWRKVVTTPKRWWRQLFLSVVPSAAKGAAEGVAAGGI